MASDKQKKDMRHTAEERKDAADYYRLHSRAVNDLITASEENSPEVSEEELAKYRSGPKLKFGPTVKALFLKWWFNGMVCFFFFWGLGNYLADVLDQLFVLGIAMGVVTDLLVNNIFRFYESPKGSNDRWMMFPKKQFASFFYNILYAFFVLFFVYTLYTGINALIVSHTGQTDAVPLGVGPILFGLFYLGFDLLFIAMKHMFQRMLRDAKNSIRK